MWHWSLWDTAWRTVMLLSMAVSSFAANPLLDIRPGQTSRDTMHRLLGDPSRQGPFEEYDATPSGLSRVHAWYDSSGKLNYARVVLVRALGPEVVCLLFDLVAPPRAEEGNPFNPVEETGGYTECYTGKGIYLHVRGGTVREIWLTRPNADIATIVGAMETTGVAVDKATVAPAKDSNTPLKRLQVPSIWCDYLADAEGIKGIGAHARVETAGLKGRLITMRVSLLDVKGNPIIDRSSGRAFSAGFTETLLHDNSCWDDATVHVPLAHLLVPQGDSLRLRWEALLPTLGACSEILLPTATPSSQSGMIRSVILGNVRAEGGSRDGAEGLWLYADVNANGFNGQVLRSWVSLRLADGRKILSKDKGYADSEGALAVGSQDTARYDTAQWKPFKLFLPYSAFGVPAGVTHRVVVTYMAACQGVGSRAEQEIVVSLP